MAVVKNLMVRAGADFSGMRREMQKGQKSVNAFKKNVTTAMKVVATAIAAIGIGRALSDSRKLYEYQIEQETKLAVVMRQRMGATNEMIDSVKRLASAQQSLGVIGDEVQLAGAQQLATFLRSDEALKSLIPAMNNLAAQQKGYNATGEDLINIGNMMGKVMEGQVGALRRVGISFSAAEEQILMYGNEQQRAATLAKVITNNVGEMNAALANTPQGRWAQLVNSFGDLKEEIGKSVSIFRDLFVPVLQRVVNFATVVAVRLQQVAHFFNALFGRSSTSQTQTQAKAMGVQVGAVEGLGDAYKQAGKEAKKAKGVLAGFDEVNTLPDPADSGGSSGGGVGGGGAGDIGDLGLSGVVPAVDSTVSQISEKVSEMAAKFKKTMEPVVSFFKNIWNTIKSYFTQKVSEIKRIWDENGKQFIQGMKNVWNAIKPIVTMLANWIWNSIKGAIDGVIKIFEGIIKFFAGVFTGDWRKAFSGIKDIIVGAFQTAWNFLNLTFIGGIRKGVVNLITHFGSSFKTIVGNIKAPFKAIDSWFSGIGIKMWNGIKTPFSSASTWFKTNVVDKISKSLTSIKDKFRTGITDGLKATLNLFIDAINRPMITLKEISVLGQKPFGKLPTIPRLARGGIVDRTTNMGNYIAGEAGKEMVVPLENTSFVDKLASALGSAVMGAMQFNNNNNSQDKDLILNIDGRTLARVITPHLVRESRRIGSNIKLNSI